MLRRFYSATTASSAGSTAILLDWTGAHVANSWKNLLTAACTLSPASEITAILPLPANTPVPTNLQLPGLQRLILAPLSTPHRAVEELSVVTRSVLSHFKLKNLLATHDSFGKNCLPRVAASVEGAVWISDVLSIGKGEQESSLSFSRSIYAGNAIAKLSTQASRPHFLTIRSTSFAVAEEGQANEIVTETFTQNQNTATASSNQNIAPVSSNQNIAPVSTFIKHEISTSKRPDLSSAKIVVAGGRALKSAQNFSALLEPLADTLNAAIGASRAAVDAGFISNDLQVGQTGKIVAPQLYIAIGISGAIQHVAGMKDSKVIVAINKDAECPIFQVADYGLVGDLFTIVPELTEKLKASQ